MVSMDRFRTVLSSLSSYMHRPVQDKFMLRNNSPEACRGPNTSKKPSTLITPLYHKSRKEDKDISRRSVQNWKGNDVRLWGGGLVYRVHALTADRSGFETWKYSLL